jgi:phage tail sheath protein FI
MSSIPLSYPGVYIQELSNGVNTITGVATSIAAFIGWAPQGSVTSPTLVESWTEYQAAFGGLNANSFLGYAVSQFFLNQGTQAYIVRLAANSDTKASVPTATVAETADATIAGMPIYASSPGLWGNSLVVAVTPSTVPGSTSFSLTVSLTTTTGTTLLESYSNLTVNSNSSQYVVAIINNDSNYITFINPAAPTALIGPFTTPAATATGTLGGGLDGDILDPTDANFPGEFSATLLGANGYQLLEQVEIFNLLCVPAYSNAADIATLQTYCAQRRAFMIVDPPQSMTISQLNMAKAPLGTTGDGSFSLSNAANSAYYFPWVIVPDLLYGGRAKLCPPSGCVAGIYASTDADFGVWKAPAGINASISGLLGLQYTLSDSQNGLLNPHAINCIRQFQTYGTVVWGARTMDGDDQVGSQWKYIPIRRLALYIESSLYYGTQWVVFQPNDETLWGQIRLNVGTFMQGLFLQGAFAGKSKETAYFVKCDGDNNPDSSTALGIVNILVGFAPLYPAEFVIIQIQQIVGQ